MFERMELLFTKVKNVGGVGFGRGGEARKGSQVFDFEMPIRHSSRDFYWNDCIYELGIQGRGLSWSYNFETHHRINHPRNSVDKKEVQGLSTGIFPTFRG